jgi:hypothetical protein
VGGSGADRDFLGQRRFYRNSKTFPLNNLPLEKTLCSSRFSTIPLWEQRAGALCPAQDGAGWPNLKDRMVGMLLRGAAGVFQAGIDDRRRGTRQLSG